MRLFGWGQKPWCREDALKEIQQITVSLEQLEHVRTTVAPQLLPEQVQILVEKAKYALTLLPTCRMRRNYLAYLYREGQADTIAFDGGDMLREEFEALRTNPKMCPDGQVACGYKEKIARLIADYPAYARHLMESREDLATFFKWALRSGCDMEVLIKFPSMAARLMACHADKRFGAVNPQGVRVNPHGFVEMQVYGGCANGAERPQGSSWVSIHDLGARIALLNRVNVLAPLYILTLGDVFKQLQEKTYKYNRVEVFLDGLSNWDAIRQGSYNPAVDKIDKVSPRQWLEQMPPVGIIAREELQARYPEHKIDDTSLKYALCAARKKLPSVKYGHNINENHAFVMIYVPRSNGIFYELPLGLQPYVLPRTKLGKVPFLGNTLSADIHFPDEGIYLSNRGQKGIIFDLNESQVAILQKHIEHEIQKGQDGKKTFCPQGNNCANWAQKGFWKIIVEPYLYDPLHSIAGKNAKRKKNLRDLEKATKAGNHYALQKSAKRFVHDLSAHELQTMIRSCHTMMGKYLRMEDLPDIEQGVLQRASHTDIKQMALEMLLVTLRTTIIFPMRTLDLDMDITFLNRIVHGIKVLVRARIICDYLAAKLLQLINLIFLASWRFSTTFKSLMFNKYSQAGNQPIPGGIWAWHEKKEERERAVREQIEKVNSLPAALNENRASG